MKDWRANVVAQTPLLGYLVARDGGVFRVVTPRGDFARTPCGRVGWWKRVERALEAAEGYESRDLVRRRQLWLPRVLP